VDNRRLALFHNLIQSQGKPPFGYQPILRFDDQEKGGARFDFLI
jgi:hypothetical protein